MGVGLNKTTAAGAAYLAMIGEEDPAAEQMAGIDYEALKSKYSIEDLVSYFVSNVDSLSAHDKRVGQSVSHYNDQISELDERGVTGFTKLFLEMQFQKRMLSNLGYGDSKDDSKGVETGNFLGAPTLGGDYWTTFGPQTEKGEDINKSKSNKAERLDLLY
tara:strand:+ start:1696 stop:2175 length:480 start_codon:yes stop_codon:yes gene_type:complete